MNHRIQGVWLCAVLAASPPVLSQQTGDPTSDHNLAADLYLPATSGAAGHFFRSDVMDAAVLFGGAPSVFFAPEAHTARVDIPRTAVSDVDRLPASAGPVSLDRLVTIGPGGLEFWTFNPLTDSFFAAAQPGSWGAASQACVLESPSAVSVLASMGGELFRGTIDASGDAVFNFSQAPSNPDHVSFPQPIEDIVPVRWLRDSRAFYAVVTAGRVYVCDDLMTLVTDFATFGPGGKVASIPMDTSGDLEGLVIAAPAPGVTVDVLAMVSAAGPPQSLFLGQGGTQGLAAEVPGPGELPRLLVSHNEGAYLEQISTEFDGNGNLRLTKRGSVPIGNWTTFNFNQFTPLVFDADRDGDDDLFFSPALTSNAQLFRIGNVLAANSAPRPLSVDLKVDNTSGIGVFKVALGAAIGPTSSYPKIELTVWRQARFDRYLNLGADAERSVHQLSQGEYELQINTEETSFFEDVYYVEARMIDTAAGLLGPATVMAVGLNGPINEAMDNATGDGSGGSLDFDFDLIPGSPFLPPSDLPEGDGDDPNLNPALGPRDYDGIQIGTPTGGGLGCVPNTPPPPPGAPPQPGGGS